MPIDISELEGVGFVSGLSEAERTDLSSTFRAEDHPVGTVLIVEGGDATKFFVLLDGHVTVHREGRHLVDLGPGDCFGEMGVIALEERSATVIATTPIKVAVAMGWDLRDLLERHAGLRDRLAATAADRRAD